MTESQKTTHFRIVYDEHELFVRKSLYWVSGRDSVDDIVQEVFLKIWKSFSSFKGNSKLRTWIYRITLNTAYDYLKKDMRLKKDILMDIPLESSSFENKVSTEQLLKKAFQKLSRKQQEVFLPYYIHGFSIQKTAELTKISEGTVKSRLSSARSLIEGHLKKHGVSI